jgi:hypothetical protein
MVGWVLREGLAGLFPAVEANPNPKPVLIRHFKDMELPRWDPGPNLAAAERPPSEVFPLPTLWQGGPVGDLPLSGRALEYSTQGREQLQAGNLESAVTSFLRAAKLQPTWEVFYSAGVTLLEAGEPEAAADKFGEAEARLQPLSATGSSSSPAVFAALVATRYAAGHAHLQLLDCLEAIFNLRRSVGALDAYVSAGGAFVHDRQHPFQVGEAGTDNYAVWATLATAYERCEGKFPSDYERRHSRKQDFAQEYPSADRLEVRDGPFSNALAACISDGPASRFARCWAYSNLNKPVWASRRYFAQAEEETVGKGLPPSVLSNLTRLVYNVAWLGADTQKDRARASTYLGYAARLDRKARVPGLDGRIASLGRYLAPSTKDYSFLAESWRQRDLTSITLDASLKPEDLKGAAWALQERWLAHLRSGRPDLMVEEVEAQISRAGTYGESLSAWKDEVQRKLRDTLLTAMQTEHRNGNIVDALSIREFRAPWLGPGWSSRALRAWLTWSVWFRWVYLLLFWLLIASVTWLCHSLVIVPYLVYTTDYYRSEHLRRHTERRREAKPFTREEIKLAAPGSRQVSQPATKLRE